MRRASRTWLFFMLWRLCSTTTAAFCIIPRDKRISTMVLQGSISTASDSVGDKDDWNDTHVAHGWQQVHEEDADELLESEQAAAMDAHDDPDPGMEAAAEERAVMLAAELIHTLKVEKQRQQKDSK